MSQEHSTRTRVQCTTRRNQPAYNQQQMYTNCSRPPRLSCDCSWQVEEAVSSYHRLQVATSLEGSENKLGLQGPRRAAIAQLAAVLKLRIQVIRSADSLLLQHHAWHTSCSTHPAAGNSDRQTCQQTAEPLTHTAALDQHTCGHKRL